MNGMRTRSIGPSKGGNNMPENVDFASFVEKRVDNYQNLQQEVQEPWKRDHDVAMACFEAQELLIEGHQIYEAIHRYDEAWRLRIFRKQCDYDVATEYRLKAVLSRWYAVSLKLLQNFARLEAECRDRGFDVAHAGQLRRNIEECASMLTPSEQLFDTERFAALKDAAIDEHLAGGSVEIRRLSD